MTRDAPPTPAGRPGTEYGVFLPVGNGGWIVSTTAPPLEASYADNRRVAVLADELGLDFVMSMGKWRGYGGTTDHWGRTLESLTLMAALAEATTRVKVWATVHANVHNPMVAAKMVATLQDVSGGRAGMNVVAGAYADEFAQMGLWDPDLDHAARYRWAGEWLAAVERLWTEDSVSVDGEFVQLADAQCRPHPAVRPTLISAGRSAEGLALAAEHCDGSFLTADDLTGLARASADVKALASARGRSIKTYSMLTVVLGDDDAQASARRTAYGRGADVEALAAMKISWGIPPEQALSMTADHPDDAAYQTAVVDGNPATVERRIAELVTDGGIDGLMLIFPDYVRDLAVFGHDVLPGLRARELAARS